MSNAYRFSHFAEEVVDQIKDHEGIVHTIIARTPYWQLEDRVVKGILSWVLDDGRVVFPRPDGGWGVLEDSICLTVAGIQR